jgi:ribosomal protein L29
MTKKESMTIKTDTELSKLLTDTRAELRAERFAAAGARAKDSNHKGKLRKVIARTLTEQHTRALRAAVVK